MEISQWQTLLKNAKLSTSTMNLTPSIKARYSSDGLTKTLLNEERCSCCGNLKSQKQVIITFNKPQRNLSIFQAETLFSLYALGKKPMDCTDYHKCEAGREFIENIKEVTVTS